MPRQSVFDDSLEDLGARRFLGKATKLEDMSAADFDQLRKASLSNRVGAEAQVRYLEVEDLQAASGLGRSTFFLPDASPVSKWTNFKKAVKEAGLPSVQSVLNRVLWWEEGERDAGRYGKVKYLEVAAIPAPGELESLVETGTPAPAPAEDRDDGYLRNLLLSSIDGFTLAELMKELEDMDVKEDEARIKKLTTDLVAEGKLRRRAGKFQVVEEGHPGEIR